MTVLLWRAREERERARQSRTLDAATHTHTRRFRTAGIFFSLSLPRPPTRWCALEESKQKNHIGENLHQREGKASFSSPSYCSLFSFVFLILAAVPSWSPRLGFASFRSTVSAENLCKQKHYHWYVGYINLVGWVWTLSYFRG